jgi:hypothetical protein
MADEPTISTAPAPDNPPVQQPHSTAEPVKPTEPAQGTDWEAEAKKWEKRSKDNHATLQKLQEQVTAQSTATVEQKKAILKAFGLADDEDPAEAAKRTATERDTERSRAEKLEQELKAERLERTAERLARKAGGNVDALLDSRGFVRALAALGDDPSEKDITKAVETALDAHPHLKQVSNGTPARSVTDTKGSPPEPPKRSRSLSEAVGKAMTA